MLMALVQIHARLANTVMLYVLILAIWGFWRFFRKEEVSSNYWGALVIGGILILLQGVVGGYLWITDLRPDRGGVHILYGFVGALGLPAVYVFTKGRQDRSVMVIYAAVALALVGIFIRSLVTG
jgi:heme A synthase